jgi:hypothetical protein
VKALGYLLQYRAGATGGQGGEPFFRLALISGPMIMRMKALSRLSMLTTMILTTFLLTACEDEPQQTQERLDDAIGQREVQDLFRDEDDPDSPRQEERDEVEEQEQR